MRRIVQSLAMAALLGTVPAFAQTGAPRSSAPASASADGVVNLNEARSEELELLPGIGPAKARSIVEHRRSHPFKKADDLVKVKGIGRKTFAELRPYLSVAGPTTLKESPKK